MSRNDNHFWVLRNATRTDRQTLSRAFINLTGAILFAVGSTGWVANFMTIGTYIFAASNVFCYFVTGVWWAFAAHDAFRNTYQARVGKLEDNTERGCLQTKDGETAATASPVRLMHPGLVQTPQAEIQHRHAQDVVRAFRILTHMEMMSAFWQVAGALAFTAGCFLSLWQDLFYLETILFWIAGSFFFLLQGIISQIICQSFWGPLLPLVPRYPGIRKAKSYCAFETTVGLTYGDIYPCCRGLLCIHRCVPGAFLNMMGSLIFTIGSVFLFYPSVAPLGAYAYLAGSSAFVVAATADINGFIDALAIKVSRK